MSKDNSIRAFPRPIDMDNDSVNGNYYPQLGMTIRDYFAGQALIAILSKHEAKWVTELVVEEKARLFAASSYMFADAMIAERSK